MESRPPQQTPPWIWLLLIAGFALIFWQFSSNREVTVPYSPWFLDQVESGNIKSLSIQGSEARGELRKRQAYPAASTTSTPLTTKELIAKFTTYFPTEKTIDTVVSRLREQKLERGEEPVRIDVQPPSTASSLFLITLLLPTFVILGVIFFLMNRTRGR